jgi:hypothetical protein
MAEKNYRGPTLAVGMVQKKLKERNLVNLSWLK